MTVVCIGGIPYVELDADTPLRNLTDLTPQIGLRPTGGCQVSHREVSGFIL